MGWAQSAPLVGIRLMDLLKSRGAHTPRPPWFRHPYLHYVGIVSSLEGCTHFFLLINKKPFIIDKNITYNFIQNYFLQFMTSLQFCNLIQNYIQQSLHNFLKDKIYYVVFANLVASLLCYGRCIFSACHLILIKVSSKTYQLRFIIATCIDSAFFCSLLQDQHAISTYFNNPTVFNIILWVAGSMGRTTHRPSV